MKLTITSKLGSGFGIIILAVLVSLYITNRTGRKYQEMETQIRTVLSPSEDRLVQLSDMMTTSKILTKNWTFIEKTESDEKTALRKLHETDFLVLRDSLRSLSEYWTEDERADLENIFVAIEDTLFKKQLYVMTQLSNMDSYKDVFIKYEIDPMVEESGEISVATQRITYRLGILIDDFGKQTQSAQEQITADFVSFQRLIVVTNIILIIIVLVCAFYSNISIVRPLKKIDALLGKLSLGNLSEKSAIKQNDEIGMIATSVNKLIDGLQSTTTFANEIGKGHFEASFQTLSNEDVLGNSLIDMRDSLQRSSNEEQKRQAEDQRRNWASKGLAQFAEIIRNNNSNTETLTHEVLFNLVRYIEANQGGVFVVNDGDPQHVYLSMAACYAYDRKKYAEKQIEVGEGLVGACYQEKETIYMTDVPHDYVEITSGLGGANPSAILIVPLKVNEEIFGVLELAAFVEFEPHVRDFVEKVSESIASAISSLKVSERTNKLLDQAKIQAQEMGEQEEELRQNMEELQATQEEWFRRESSLRSSSDAIKEALCVMELSLDMVIDEVNSMLVAKLEIGKEQLLQHNYLKFLDNTRNLDGVEYESVWNNLRNGLSQETFDQLKIKNSIYRCRQMFIPQKNEYQEISKFLCITLSIEK